MPTPEEITDQLHAMVDLIKEDMEIFLPDQRKVLRDAGRVPEQVVWLTVYAIESTDVIAEAIGMSGDELRDLIELSNRWSPVVSHLRTLFTGVQGAQLARRHQVAKIVSRVFMIASQLAKDDKYGDLRSYVSEVKRIKSYDRRKKKTAENLEA